jgi:hypothetical protein
MDARVAEAINPAPETAESRKVGRPVTTGKGTQIGMRWHQPMLEAIDAWAERQPDRSEAIRRLVQRGLDADAVKARRKARREDAE